VKETTAQINGIMYFMQGYNDDNPAEVHMFKPFLGWLFGPHVFEIMAFFLAATGVAFMLAPTREDMVRAHWFFGAAFVFLVGRVAHWLITVHNPPIPKVILAALMFAGIGAGWIYMYQVVQDRLAKLEYSATSVTTPKIVEQASAPITARPPTLLDLFNSDFPNVMKLTTPACELHWGDGSKLVIRCQAYLDFDGKSEFVGLYIPSSPRTFDACLKLDGMADYVVRRMPQLIKSSAGYRDQMTDMHDLMFSRRVFLYHEDLLTIPQKAAIIRAYERKRLSVQFRGPDYLGDQVATWYHKRDSKPQ